MDWNIITSTAEALNCAIILLQHTAVPVALDLKGSWASLHWLRYTRVHWTDVKQHFCVMYSGDNVLGWWLHGHQIWGEHRWVNDYCTVGGRAEITLTHTNWHTGCCNRPVVGKQQYNMTISYHTGLLSSLQWHWWLCERLKSTWRWRVTVCDSQPGRCTTEKAVVESN